jgi:hypothetical protein
MNQQKVFYYYCSVTTFLNIVKNNSIFLSDPLKMNDDEEIKWFFHLLNEVDENEEIFKDNHTVKYMKEKCADATRFLDTNGQENIYICCFSKEGDLLSQWRAYGDDGRGIAIGFDLDKITKRNDGLLLKDVRYRYRLTEEDLSIIYGLDYAEHAATTINRMRPSEKEDPYKIFINQLLSEIAVFKNGSFKEEQEVRLIYSEDTRLEEILGEQNGLTNKKNTTKLPHAFRIHGNNDLIEYVEMMFNPEELVKVCIGPKCRLNETDVKKIVKLYVHKEDIDVKKSSSSYR